MSWTYRNMTGLTKGLALLDNRLGICFDLG